jgi:ATP-dependent DNA ligase
MLRKLALTRLVIDGELVIEIAGHLAFDALQMRLHPADSRIRKLSAETPARLVLFDMLITPDGARAMDLPLTARRQGLEKFARKAGDKVVLSPRTRDLKQAKTWLSQAGDGSTDGVVAKRMNDIYRPGARAMIKVKKLRTDCVVGGFRYGAGGREVGSLLLGLYNEADSIMSGSPPRSRTSNGGR